MRQHSHTEAIRADNQDFADGRFGEPALPAEDRQRPGLPGRLLTASEVAAFIGCHEETVRRAYWRGLLRSQRFGVRGRRVCAAWNTCGST